MVHCHRTSDGLVIVGQSWMKEFRKLTVTINTNFENFMNVNMNGSDLLKALI